MINYRTSGLDEIIITLLLRLGCDFPVRSLLLDIENNLLTVIKVTFDEKLYGILVTKQATTRRGQKEFVINHAIAADDLDISFNNILGVSLERMVFANGYDRIRIHTDRAGLNKIAQRWMGEPTEYIFTKEKSQWADQTANLQALKQQQPAQPTKE